MQRRTQLNEKGVWSSGKAAAGLFFVDSVLVSQVIMPCGVYLALRNGNLCVLCVCMFKHELYALKQHALLTVTRVTGIH